MSACVQKAPPSQSKLRPVPEHGEWEAALSFVL